MSSGDLPVKSDGDPTDAPVVRRIISGKPRHLMGWKPDRPDHRDLVFKASQPKLVLQALVDLSAKTMPPIEDQGDIGSCVANSSTDSVEFLYIVSGKEPPELSRLYVYYWCRYLDGISPNEDSGTTIRTAMKCLASYGACRETSWPYDVNKYNIKPSAALVREGQGHQILRYYRTPTLAHIRSCLYDGFPVVFGFSVPSSMHSDETALTGVVQYPGDKDSIIGGHAVLMVGYDDVKKRVKFKNSWSSEWGDKGYGYLPYDFITNGLASDFWTIRQAEL